MREWDWHAYIMGAEELRRFGEKVAELQQTDPNIDWSDVKVIAGSRRVALWLSEVDEG